MVIAGGRHRSVSPLEKCSRSMKDFLRVLQISARQRLTILGLFGSSLLIAVFWGINIGAVYPLVEIVFKGDSIPGYIDQKLVDSRQQIEEHQRRIAELQQQLAGDPERPRKVRSRLRVQELGHASLQRTVAALEVVQPWAQRHLPQAPYRTLLVLMGFLLVGTVIKLVALVVNLMLVQVVTERTAIQVRSLFYRRALQLDLDEFGDTGSATLTSRLTTDVGYLNGGINTLLGRLVREPLKLVVCLGGAAFVCWRLLLFVMIIMPLIAMVTHHLSRAIRRSSRRVMSEMSQMFATLNDSFAGIRLIKISNTQAAQRAKFAAGMRAYCTRSIRLALYSVLARGSSEFLGTIVVCLGVIAGGYLVINEKTHLLGIRMCLHPLEVGQVLLFFGFLIGAADPAKKLAEVWSDLQRGIAAATRIFEVIDRPVRVRNPARPTTPQRPHRLIQLRDVHFRYPSGPPVLRGVDLQIPHGQTVAIIGPNGCGKSTLLSLLCRFDDPQQGAVMIDDTPLDQMRIRDLRRRIGLVTQRTTLFDSTIAENIAHGRRQASEADIVRAAKLAYADDFIRQKTPDSYQTRLGNHGTRLSGGQMQRIALARAFLRDPDILILDEATSQIDLESEQLIHQALAEFLRGRTGLMVTHRRSTLALADQIVIMDEGRITDIGRHDDLLTRNRFYQSLWGGDQSQAAA